MDCIYCNGKTIVSNSRPQKRLHQVWRRRCCTICKAVFTTTEGVELASSLVVRSISGSIEPFSRDILFMSVVRSLGHRTDAVRDAGGITATIVVSLRKTATNATIERADIIRTTRQILQRFDEAASVQYGAYHKI